EDPSEIEQRKIFWEAQEKLLQATLYRTTSLESRIRQATKEALREIDAVGVQCTCRRPEDGGCRNCLQRELSIRLQSVDFNCYICKSKWRSSPEIPSGEHTYLEVVDKSKAKKGEWLGTYERRTSAPLAVGYSDRQQKPKASMLTSDLRENLPALHYTAVEAVW
ncbi:hypothetical protein Golax_005771, partial [Gossypium laxum]|nr:hypothetical protein [Gossypium laxum]